MATLLYKAVGGDVRVRLAKFTEEDFQLLEDGIATVGYGGFMKVERVVEEVMDWQYPSQILNTGVVSSLAGSCFGPLRHKIKRYETVLTITSIHDKSSLRAWPQVVRIWGEQMHERGKSDRVAFSYYDALLQLVGDESMELDGLLFWLGDSPVGLSVWHIGPDGVANQLALLCDTNRIYLSQAKVVWTSRYLHARQIDFLNLGGSETESLDRFKRQFMPTSSIQSQSALLDLTGW